MEIELVDMVGNGSKKNHYGTRKGNILDEIVAPEIWLDDYVSIVSKKEDIWDDDSNSYIEKYTHNMYFNCEIGAPELYSKSCYFLREIVNKNDVIYININSGGGNVDSAMMLRDAIKDCEGKVIARLSGIVASSATLIALACDDIKCGESVSWLSHNYSAGVSGKGHEIKAQSEFMEKELNRTFKIIHNGFFTDKEIEEIIDGKDYWLNVDEIMERWNRYYLVEDSSKDGNND